MSREDPQFKLRMPVELRSQAELAAKAAGRSLNSELVSRIEASFLTESPLEKLIPAERARELSLMARAGISDEIRRRSIEAIAKAVRFGHNEAIARLDDLHLENGIPASEVDELIQSAANELKSAGYKVEIDDVSAILIEF